MTHCPHCAEYRYTVKYLIHELEKFHPYFDELIDYSRKKLNDEEKKVLSMSKRKAGIRVPKSS